MALTLQQRIEINKLARHEAQEFIDSRKLVGMNEEAVEQYWKTYIEYIQKNILCTRVKQEANEMTLEEARAFEKEELPFGEFKGRFIDEVPLRYLINISDPNPFIDQVRKYVKFCQRNNRG